MEATGNEFQVKGLTKRASEAKKFRPRDSFLGSFGPFVSLFGLFRLFLSVAFPLMNYSGSFPIFIA
jgi:hypothetical protein